jgi:plasmid stabilization system protein ParE
MKRHTLDEARREYLDALVHYRDIRPQLGERFEAAITEAMARIMERPNLIALRPEGYRRLNLRDFPCYIAYAVRGDSVWIVAVAHARRRPKYWIRRLESV